MHRPALRARPIRLSIGTEPPTEFCLFPVGEIETTKGTFVLTDEDARACVERHATYGNDLSIDYGHGVFEESEGTPQRAAGWIGGLEVRDAGLWATGVTWTETAARMIRAREQRYFSPAFLADEDGHITEILNVALTLMPATHNLQPLVASRRGGRVSTNRKKTSMDEKYVSASELAKLADDIEKMGEGDDKDKPDFKAMAERCRKLAESGETMAKLAEDEPPPSEKKEKDEEKQAAGRIVAAAREATGEKEPARIVGALKALGESKGTVSTLTARVAELEALQKASAEQTKKDRVTSLVKAAATPGPRCKITPPEVESLIGWGMVDEKALTAYLDAKPLLVAASVVHTPASKPDKAAKLAALTDTQKEVIARSGLTPEEFVERLEKLPA